MKQETKTKFKETWEKAKVPVIVTGTAIGAFVLGDKYAQTCCTKGIEKFHKAGAMKFFDPETGIECSIERAVEIVTEMVKNKKI